MCVLWFFFFFLNLFVRLNPETLTGTDCHWLTGADWPWLTATDWLVLIGSDWLPLTGVVTGWVAALEAACFSSKSTTIVSRRVQRCHAGWRNPPMLREMPSCLSWEILSVQPLLSLWIFPPPQCSHTSASIFPTLLFSLTCSPLALVSPLRAIVLIIAWLQGENNVFI